LVKLGVGNRLSMNPTKKKREGEAAEKATEKQEWLGGKQILNWEVPPERSATLKGKSRGGKKKKKWTQGNPRF